MSQPKQAERPPQGLSEPIEAAGDSPAWKEWERLDDKLDELIGYLEEMTEDGEDPPDGGCR